MDALVLLFSDARGIFIPQNWAEECAPMPGWTGYDQDDADILLEGPEHEWYWEAWDNVLQSAEFRPLPKGRTTLESMTDDERAEYDAQEPWTLHQDGDCWAMNASLMTREEKLNFGWEECDLDDEDDDDA